MKKHLPGFIVILILFVLSALVVLPTGKGVLFGKPIQLGLDLQGGLHLVYQADLSDVADSEKNNVLSGVVSVISNRVNPLGVSEPNIAQQGADRIVVDLPGTALSDAQKQRIGSTALLVFGELVTGDEAFTWENALGKWKPATDTGTADGKVLDSSYFKNNTFLTTNSQTGAVLLNFEWTDEGAKISEAVTTRMLGKRLGIFEGDTTLLGDDGMPVAPTVNAVITDKGVIEGLSISEAQLLSKQLNAGRLPVPLTIIYQNTVSPVLGSDFVHLSYLAGIVGVLLVMAFMIFFYRLPGFLASLALLFYVVLILAIYKLVPVTLSLPGIGGFILSIGMAVDANVLIFERMKDELRAKRTLGAAIEAGFSRAWSAIWDSNITTLIVCGILVWVGATVTGGEKVQGFALTLGIGVIASMFTAIMVTRTFLRMIIGTNVTKNLNLFTTESGDRNA
ncbi:protein translocase subunit SecD [Dehalogenimonas etheniformans]|uniref:Protein translocase subunit SecD n=1 Tax=Dehalogenimonas etheniformans TaxID=1536648 RepID=A0A2P5P6V2_9CHLR|nr:protein translocase subunit SecD [Dehalogenimonas etheniformans]PPD57999.1 protein translocase subunit SecD [Dehalogenimonas etheniformans]QNT75348.1 protein translocase subunit SecD [Dehalogenimonas etheniformans]